LKKGLEDGIKDIWKLGKRHEDLELKKKETSILWKWTTNEAKKNPK
jgi:hypothetical protein